MSAGTKSFENSRSSLCENGSFGNGEIWASLGKLGLFCAFNLFAFPLLGVSGERVGSHPLRPSGEVGSMQTSTTCEI